MCATMLMLVHLTGMRMQAKRRQEEEKSLKCTSEEAERNNTETKGCDDGKH